jgi:hypothetical protein
MKRIAKRIAGSFVYCMLAWGGVSACASEDATFPRDAGGKCDPAFCHAMDMIRGCCLNTGACGVDLGNGCVPVKKDSGP